MYRLDPWDRRPAVVHAWLFHLVIAITRRVRHESAISKWKEGCIGESRKLSVACAKAQSFKAINWGAGT